MIKVELLDYKYRENNTGFTNQNLVNFNNVDPAVSSSYWEIDNIGQISIDGSQTSTKYISPICGNLTDTAQYEIEVSISNYNHASGSTSSGEVGISSQMTDGTIDAALLPLRRTSNGSVSIAFTCEANAGLKIFATADVTATVKAKLIQRKAIMFDESVMGVLDVGDSDDFPLALTFSIAEVRDLNSRTGTYSKTFNIPATKNNNRILKHSYYEGVQIPNNNIATKKDARIVVGDNFILTGLLQITAIGKASNPLYYSCVFYGNNVGWAANIGNKLLMDLAVQGGAKGSGWDNLNFKGANTGIGLKVHHTDIRDTWEIDNALNKTPFGGSQTTNTSPVVYPMVGYGENNEGGDTGTIQLLLNAYEATGGASGKTGYYGFYNSGSGSPYPNPVPSCDWRPAIFIYDIIHAIFNQEGYTVDSNFIESDMFKKLIMLLPNFVYNNPTDKYENNSIVGDFNHQHSGIVNTGFIGGFVDTPTSGTSGTGWRVWKEYTIKFNGDGASGTDYFRTDLNSAIYDDSTGYFTITENGFYTIKANDFSVWIESICEGTAIDVSLDYLRMKCEINTVGQTSWVNIGEGWAVTTSNSLEGLCPQPDFYDKSQNFEELLIEDRYLNAGDRIRFRVQWRLDNLDSNSDTLGAAVYLFGGTDGVAVGGTPNGSNQNASLSLKLAGEKVEYGQTYDLKNVIDNESSQLDFLKGVMHSFNLQFTTDVDSKRVYIEPFNEFYYNIEDAIDWTSKIDLSQSFEDKFINSNLKSEFIFKYKSDSNDKVVEHRGNTYWSGISDEYPYREFVDGEFETGVATFENPFFAGTYNSQDGMTGGGSFTASRTPYRANLWGLCDSGAVPTAGSSCRPDKGYGFVPRLLHYVKDDCASAVYQYWAKVQQYGADHSGTGIKAIKYIQPGYTSYPSGGDPTFPILSKGCSTDNYHAYGSSLPPLTYNSVNQASWDCSTDTFYSPFPYKGLYQTYYQGMIEMAKINPKVKVVHLNLKASDMVNLDLRRLVYLDGYYYRINRVIDYKPNSNKTTKVELVFWDLQAVWPTDVTFNT